MWIYISHSYKTYLCNIHPPFTQIRRGENISLHSDLKLNWYIKNDHLEENEEQIVVDFVNVNRMPICIARSKTSNMFFFVLGNGIILTQTKLDTMAKITLWNIRNLLPNTLTPQIARWMIPTLIIICNGFLAKNK